MHAASASPAPPHGERTRTQARSRPTALGSPPQRGADEVGRNRGVRVVGSPPLARGRPDRRCRRRSVDGFTPAYAGPTTGRCRACWALMVHPRLRGADDCRVSHASRCRGSPPLARGRRAFAERGARISGFTPACAGPTLKPKPMIAKNVRVHCECTQAEGTAR